MKKIIYFREKKKKTNFNVKNRFKIIKSYNNFLGDFISSILIEPHKPYKIRFSMSIYQTEVLRLK